MKAYIVYQTYTTLENKTIIQLFGRLENGQSFATLNKYRPYFYIRKSDYKKVMHLEILDVKGKDSKDFSSGKTKGKKKLSGKCESQETSLTNFNGEKVLKIEFNTRTELNNAYKELYKEIEIYEADIRPHYKYIIDNNLLGIINIEGDYEPSEKIDRVYNEPKISPAIFSPKTRKLLNNDSLFSGIQDAKHLGIKLISLDIETDTKGNLYCIGLYGENYQKNFMITSQKLKDTISCNDEADCLERFKAELIKIDPDIITGWNVIDFDFKYLKDSFKKNKIKFDIGRTNDEPILRIEGNFFRSSSIDIPGRQVLDGLNLIKDPFIKDSPLMKHRKFKSFTLEYVSQEILKQGKLLKGKNRHKEIEELYETQSRKSLQKLVDYNILDCKLVYDILMKTKIVDLALERSQLTGLPLDRLTASIAAFDSLYIREAKSRGLVSPTTRYKSKETKIKGGYVNSLEPGIYKNVLILDFKSLYSSIIRTFNIDPASLLKKKEKGAIQSPNKAYFKNEDGILPMMIERLHKEREKAKKEKRDLASHAIKIIMNSFWGVLASPNLRYFNLEMANAITHFGQFIIKKTAEEIEKKGYKVLYSDTDSVFIETKLGKQKANKLGKEIEEYINKFYENFVKKEYSRKSYLELEFEKQYLTLMIPQTRGKETIAAKKRYAGLVEKKGKEELEITGLEAIRGDWTVAAQEFQVELIDKLFHDQPVESFIKDYVRKLEQGKLDDKLIYRKSIRKNLKAYTKTTPPHVKAARKLDKLESNIIEYYITTNGPEPLQKLKHPIDYKHYIEKQIKPIADQILVLLKEDFENITQKSKQTKLFTF